MGSCKIGCGSLAWIEGLELYKQRMTSKNLDIFARLFCSLLRQFHLLEPAVVSYTLWISLLSFEKGDAHSHCLTLIKHTKKIKTKPFFLIKTIFHAAVSWRSCGYTVRLWLSCTYLWFVNKNWWMQQSTGSRNKCVNYERVNHRCSLYHSIPLHFRAKIQPTTSEKLLSSLDSSILFLTVLLKSNIGVSVV